MRGLTLLTLALGACSFAETGEDWRSQIAPSGPCYEANLLDGLDTTSTDEAHALFACLNATGTIEAYAPLDAALDGDTRDGLVGIVLATWVQSLPETGLSLTGLVEGALALLEDPSGLFDTLHLGLELVYGAPWPWLGASVPLNSQTSLDDGLLVPLLPVAGLLAGDVLNEDLAPLSPLAEALRADATKSVLWTLASIGTSIDPTLSALDAAWPTDLADVIVRTADGSNDRWADASGNSIRDLASALFTYEGDSRITLDHLAVVLDPIVADARLRDALELVLTEQVAAGRTDVLPAQVLYLASVDSLGGMLSDGEDSALVALVRLLHDADTDVDCSIDLVFFDVDISLGNLSVELLELLARQDPGTVDGGVGLLGELLGVSLTDDILDAVADSGVCPEIDAQLVADLHAIDRLADPETDELLYVLLDVLAAFDDLGQVPALVDLLGEAHELGLVPPVEEALRDTADTALADDLVAALPVLLDPWAYHDPAYLPSGIPPLDFALAWDTVGDVLAVDEAGESRLAALAGPVKVALAQDATWEVVAELGELLEEPDALSAGALGIVAQGCEADPALGALDTLADTLEDDAFVRPALVLVEAAPLRDAIAATELTREGPLPFTARLVHGGTLQVLLDTLAIFSSLLPEDDA